METHALENLTMDAIALQLGRRDLVILDLHERIDRMLAIPGVREAIAAYENPPGLRVAEPPEEPSEEALVG